VPFEQWKGTLPFSVAFPYLSKAIEALQVSGKF
jgi:hypothetical protein